MKAAPLLLLALGACAAAPRNDPDSLAAAESAFAAQSVREDMRAAFMANFGPDGLFVRDGWVGARDWLGPRPAPPIVLDWRPAYVEVAGSGDLGLSTGPWKLVPRDKPGAAPGYGQFVSIWHRDPGDSPWRVLVDLGIANPGPALWDAPLVGRVARTVRYTMPLAEAEQRFQRLAREHDARAAYQAFGAGDLRLYREGSMPVSTRAEAVASIPAGTPGAWQVDEVRTAGSGDFGYTRGSLVAAGGTQPQGYFLRVWRHEPAGWRIALDVVQPPARR